MKSKTCRSLALCVLFSFGSTAPGWAASLPSADGKEAAQNAKILPGDILNITVYPADEYNKEVTVQPDGKVELSLLGSIQVKDLTTKQLQDLLEVRYSKYVDNPRITINVRHFSGRRVAILGEIHAPGYYEYRDGMKVLELVSLAGGINDNARTTRFTLLRDGLGAGTRFNFQAVLDGNLDRDLALQPGDTIYVPKTPLNKKATWMTNNILPWLTLGSLVATLVILAKTN